MEANIDIPKDDGDANVSQGFNPTKFEMKNLKSEITNPTVDLVENMCSHKQQQESKDVFQTSQPMSKNFKLNSKFDIDFDCCLHLHEMNRQLDKEEEYNEKSRRAPTRKARVLIFKKELQNDQLIKMFKTTTNNLIKVNFNNFDSMEINEFRDYFKLIQTHMELTKLLFNLTSPLELLSINRNFIYTVLNNKIEFDEQPVVNKSNKIQSNSKKIKEEYLLNSLIQTQQTETKTSSTTTEAQPSTSQKAKEEIQRENHNTSFRETSSSPYEQNPSYISHCIDEFKNIFIKNDYFMDLSTSLVKLLEFYSHLVEKSNILTTKEINQTSQIKQTHLSNFKTLILNDLILCLSLLRNICLEKNDIKFTLIVCRLFDFKSESILISLCNLKKLNKDLLFDKKYDNLSFVLSALLFQIFSLLFSKLNLINNKSSINAIENQIIPTETTTTTNTTLATTGGSNVVNTPASNLVLASVTPPIQSKTDNSQINQSLDNKNEEHIKEEPKTETKIQTKTVTLKNVSIKPTFTNQFQSSSNNDKNNNNNNNNTKSSNKMSESNGSSSSSFKSSNYTKKSTTLDKNSNKSTEDTESLAEKSLEKRLKNGEDIVKEHECKYKLNKLGVNLCKSGGFAYLVENMLRLLNKNLDINEYFDISYFFWFIKFVIKNFLIKNLEIDEHFKKYKNDHNSYKSFILNNFLNSKTKSHKSILETSFLNDSKSKSAKKTRKVLLSYDLLAFICFKMLNSFERLIFDSNKKNMERLEKHRLKQLAQKSNYFNPNSTSSKFEYEFSHTKSHYYHSHHSHHNHNYHHYSKQNISSYTQQPLKVANINYLRVLYLSLTCLHEMLDCIRNHLSYLNSSRSNFYFKIKEKTNATSNDKKNDINNKTLTSKKNEYVTNYYEFISFLNEFLNFEQLKQSFCMLMRFYCYNEHLYTKELIKYILLTNQLFLNTYENVFEFIKQIKLIKELERDYCHQSQQQHDETGSNKNASFTHNDESTYCGTASTVSTVIIKKSAYSFRKIYDLYANSDTSFIIKYVLSQFVYNDPILNRCVIDLLDSLMTKSQKREYIFHMNLALSLANIAMLENFRQLDQRTKDLVANMLNEIRNLCRNKPDLANKILFDVHHSKSANNIFNNLSNLSNRKRSISKLYSKTETKVKTNYNNKKYRNKRPRLDHTNSSENLNESLRYSSSASSLSTSMTSSLSSSTTNNHEESSSSPSSPISSLRSTSASNAEGSHTPSPLSSIKQINSDSTGGNSMESIPNNNLKDDTTHLSNELKLIIENEFLFCLFSLDAFDGQQQHAPSSDTELNFDQARIFRFLTNSDHLYRIFNYLIRLFESYNRIKLTSWQIYHCLLNMKFDMNDKINYIREMNEYKKTGKFCFGLNIGFSKLKDDFFRSNECINLRIVCSTSEFRELVRKTYIKYLIEKLCIKSKHIRSAIFWLYNRLKIVKSYKNYKWSNNGSKQNKIRLNDASGQYQHQSTIATTMAIVSSATTSTSTSLHTSMFELKLINFYYINKIGIPFIPFAFELQQVFHSIDFSRLLDLLGIITSNSSFPFLPNDWLDSNSTALNDCLNIVEKCLGI